MTASTHNEVVKATVENLWSFIENKGEWATLIPGYLHHEFKSDDEMIWVFEGDFGIIKKPVKVSLKVTAVEPQQKLSFSLEGLSDNINGGGYFSIQSQDEQQTLTGHLDLKAGGFLAAMINPVLENYVPATIKSLVQAMAQQIAQTTV